MSLRTFKVSFFCEKSNLIGLEAPSAMAAVAAARRAFETEHYDACVELGFSFDGFEAREVTMTPYQVTFVHRQYYDEPVVARSGEEAVSIVKRLLERGELAPERSTDGLTGDWFAHPVEGGQDLWDTEGTGAFSVFNSGDDGVTVDDVVEGGSL